MKRPVAEWLPFGNAKDDSAALADRSVEWWIVGTIALTVVLIHLATSGGYGYFRDELYYIACSKHPAAGYVDHPPLSIFLLYVERKLLGDSLPAIRFLPALASGMLILLTGWLVHEFGGRRFAQLIAALSVGVAPYYLGTFSFFSMNAFEPLLWTLGGCLLVRILRTGNDRLWLWFGVVAGVGLETKHSMLFFCFAVAAGLLFARQWKYLASRWLWAGVGAALLISLPNILWEIHYNWPTLEFMCNAQLHKNYHASIGEFIWGQILLLNPVVFPVWIAGLGYYLFSARGRLYRTVGWAYVAMLLLMVAEGAKIYYLAPIYPLLIAPGAVAVERFVRQGPWNRVARAWVGALVVGGIATMPLVLPILPPAAAARYAGALAIGEQIRMERSEAGRLPQYFADRFGWPEKARAVAEVYDRLSPEERGQSAIFADNYGEAGAIDFFGPKLGLPRAISGHNNYWLWGPGKNPIRNLITIGVERRDLEGFCTDISMEAAVRCEYCMPYEADLPIYLCRGLRRPIKDLWADIKNYI